MGNQNNNVESHVTVDVSWAGCMDAWGDQGVDQAKVNADLYREEFGLPRVFKNAVEAFEFVDKSDSRIPLEIIHWRGVLLKGSEG